MLYKTCKYGVFAVGLVYRVNVTTSLA